MNLIPFLLFVDPLFCSLLVLVSPVSLNLPPNSNSPLRCELQARQVLNKIEIKKLILAASKEEMQ